MFPDFYFEFRAALPAIYKLGSQGKKKPTYIDW